jgi:hypothetical protein
MDVLATHDIKMPDSRIWVSVAVFDSIDAHHTSWINLLVQLFVADIALIPGIFRNQILSPGRNSLFFWDMGQVAVSIFSLYLLSILNFLTCC